MSRTEVYAINSDGDVVPLGEAQNGMRGALWIWNHLWAKYLKRSYVANNPLWHYGLPIMDADELERLWTLGDDGSPLTFNERIVIRTTFDNVIVKADDLETVAANLEAFEDCNENIEKQAALLRQAATAGYRGVCWNQTSVNASPWHTWDEDADKEVPYNIDTGDKHWFLELGEPA